MLQVSYLQVTLLQKRVPLLLAPRFWKQVVVRNFFWITYFIFLDLVEIDALSKLIRFTEGDNWDSVLASQVSDH